jgi:2-polyprenyl-3-methyl-5-hydroxy-6-metoxy-1,4-benzoquinol methylase
MRKLDYDRHEKLYDFLLKLNVPFLKRLVLGKVYDQEFFREGEEWKKASAAKVAEIITSALTFGSVLDIGCGMGIYLEEFRKLGKEVVGCDYSPDGLKLVPEGIRTFQADVTKRINSDRKYDLVVCFEVAEHIHNRHSRQLVANCTGSGDTVLFTAAPVGQGGVGHINEQPYEFWIGLFRGNGFRFKEEQSMAIREIMQRENVVPWIAKNLMLFTKDPVA